MSKYKVRDITEEEAKEITKEGYFTFIGEIAGFFIFPAILMAIWNNIIAVKFGLDINFNYWEMFCTWMFFQIFFVLGCFSKSLLINLKLNFLSLRRLNL